MKEPPSLPVFWIILVLLLLLFVFYPKIENFLPFNTPIVDTSKNVTILENETLFLNKVFAAFNKEEPIAPLEKYPHYKKHPLSSYLNESLQLQLSELFKFVKSNDNNNQVLQISVMKDPYNVETATVDTFHYIRFNTDVNFKQFGSTRRLLVLCKLTNIDMYILSSGEYSPILPFSIVNDISIVNIQVDDTVKGELKMFPKPLDIPQGIDSYNLFEIKNPLHLLDPFVTSTKDMMITPEMVQQFEEIVIKKQKAQKEPHGICFNTTNVSAKSKEECLDSNGTWDYEPKFNEECPFFMANQNYPNSFGNLRNSYCQMPKNTKQIGYRFYSPNPEVSPLCYNCQSNLINQGTLGTCCDEQLNKDLYPTLVTPDYAFEGDQAVRKEYVSLFKSKNLSIN